MQGTVTAVQVYTTCYSLQHVVTTPASYQVHAVAQLMSSAVAYLPLDTMSRAAAVH
jgi:hypothetical protein